MSEIGHFSCPGPAVRASHEAFIRDLNRRRALRGLAVWAPVLVVALYFLVFRLLF